MSVLQGRVFRPLFMWLRRGPVQVCAIGPAPSSEKRCLDVRRLRRQYRLELSPGDYEIRASGSRLSCLLGPDRISELRRLKVEPNSVIQIDVVCKRARRR